MQKLKLLMTRLDEEATQAYEINGENRQLRQQIWKINYTIDRMKDKIFMRRVQNKDSIINAFFGNNLKKRSWIKSTDYDNCLTDR